MDDRRALMAAIIANPDEDTPRLALADWLQEHGDKADQARAEFMRLQIHAAGLPVGDEQSKLFRQAVKLEKTHCAAWQAPLSAIGKGNLSSLEFAATGSGYTRGLLSHMLIPPGDFSLKAVATALPDALAAVGVEHLGLYSSTKRIADLAASKAIQWVAKFQYPELDDAGLAAFAASPHFAHLSGLEFTEANVTDAGLQAFAKTSGTIRLRHFELASGGGLTRARGKYTAAGILAIVNNDRFPLLDSLDMESDQPAKFAWPTFLADVGMNRLVRLKLCSSVPMATLAACPHLIALEELSINSAHITDNDATTLLQNAAFSKLTKLKMYGMNWGHPRLSKPVEDQLRARFGEGVLDYSPEQR